MQEDQDTQEDGYDSFTIKVDPGQSPIRIDKFLFDRLSNVSRSKIQKAIKVGNIKVDEQTIKSNHKVSPDEQIQVIFPKSSSPDHVIPEAMPLDIRYEDDYLMVVHKPSGLVVHPGVGNYTGTLVNGLVHYLQERKLPVMEGNLPDRAGLVHRIDKDTSGLLVIAKQDDTLYHLAKQFFDHSVKREYVAIIWGELPEPKGTIDLFIGRDPNHRIIRKAFPEGEQGKRAITHYEVEQGLYYVSKVKFHLETGRTHQIRVHMAHLGHPIFNDTLYKGDQIRKGTVFTKYKQFVQNCFSVCNRHALHAKSLGFIHPVTQEEMYFEAPLPDDMASLWAKWNHYVEHKKELQ